MRSPSTTTVYGAAALATIDQAARYLQLSPSMIRKLIYAGDIPVQRYGTAVRVPWSWLRTQAASPETAATPAEARA